MTIEQGETALDAVNAALGDALAEPADTTPEAESDVADTEVDGNTDGDTDAAETEGADGDGEGEGTEGDEPAAGRVRDPATGKFLPKAADKPAEAAKPAAKPAEKPADKPVVEPKKADPVNDPIPKDLKPQTQERIRALISTTKEATAESARIKQDFDYMVEGVKATGASPEQYGETLSWLALFNSSDPAQQEKALELVESVAERLATFLGKDRAVGDPLSAHADLKEAVAKGQVTPQYAKEIARTRNSSQFRTQLTDSARQEQEQSANHERETTQARADLTGLEQTLAATDPNWAQKKAILVATLKPVFATIPPREWKSKFEQAYRNMPAQVGPAPIRVPANQPLRAGKNPAGGQSKAPGSMMDAVNAALAGLEGKR